MASFTERLIGAAKLDVHTYDEVEADATATTQAMAVVLISSVAGGIGSLGLGVSGGAGLVAGGLAALVSWVVWAFLTYVIGTRLLPEPQTHADMGQLLRTLGFAQAPGIARMLAGLPGVGPLVIVVVSLWMFAAMVIAIRQALDYTSVWRAVGVCFIGWIIVLIPTAIILSMVGPGTT